MFVKMDQGLIVSWQPFWFIYGLPEEYTWIDFSIGLKNGQLHPEYWGEDAGLVCGYGSHTLYKTTYQVCTNANISVWKVKIIPSMITRPTTSRR
jgi:hypothetical protein